jgi:hypothetical protein
VSTVLDSMKLINNIRRIYYYDFSHLMEVLLLFVKFNCPHCNDENYVSLLVDNGSIVEEDRDKLTSYLYDRIEVNDIFFAEELIDEILNVLSKTEMKEINLHQIVVDTFGTAGSAANLL